VVAMGKSSTQGLGGRGVAQRVFDLRSGHRR
jgi:hypothetical protein